MYRRVKCFGIWNKWEGRGCEDRGENWNKALTDAFKTIE